LIQTAFSKLCPGSEDVRPLATAISLASFYKPIYLLVKHNKESDTLELYVQGKKVEDLCNLANKLFHKYNITTLYFKRIKPSKIEAFLKAMIADEENILQLVDHVRNRSIHDGMLEKAQSLSAAGELEAALEIYKGLFPTLQVLIEQIDCLFSLGKIDDAKRCLHRALSIDAKNLAALSMLSVFTEHSVGRSQSAISTQN